MVGAGTTGLACALVLAARGFHVTVLERRLDALDDSGQAALGEAAALLERFNADTDGDDGAMIREIRKLRGRYWATSERNVLLDEHTQKYLSALGIDVSVLPVLESIEFCGVPGGPSFTTELDRRTTAAEADGLHVKRMIYQRNWCSLVPLSTLQHLLRSAVEKQSRISLSFGTGAEAVSLEQGRVHVQLTDGATAACDFLVVADGGGRRSLARALQLPRTIDHKEHVNFGVFASDPRIGLFGRPTSTVFSYNALLKDGWIGVFCTGRTFSIAVNARLPDGRPAPTARERLAELGVSGRFVEPPMSIGVEVSRMAEFSVGSRVLFAGDAAMSGNPRFGLGVQFGLLWAQALSRALDAGLLSGQTGTAMAAYAAEGDRIASERRSYELAWLDLLDATVIDEGSFIDATLSEAVFESIVDFDVTLEPSGNDRLIGTRVVMDFDRSPGELLEPLGAVFHQVGRAELDLLLRWALADGGGTAVVSAGHPIYFRMGSETLLVDQGVLSLTRESDGWIFSLSAARMRLISEPETSADGAARSEAEMAISRLGMRIPDRFVDQVMARLPHRIPALGMLRERPYSVRVRLREGEELAWGSLRLRFSGDPRLRMDVERTNGRSVRMVIMMEQGRLQPLTITRFSRESGVSSARWLASFSNLTGGVFDGIVDTWAGMLGRQVTRVDFRMNDDGSALATFGAGIGLSVYLTCTDVLMLQEQLLKAAALAELVPQYQRGIVSVQTGSLPPH